jgi:hypothetical protein
MDHSFSITGPSSDESSTYRAYQYIDGDLYDFLKLVISESQTFESPMVKWVEQPKLDVSNSTHLLWYINPCASEINLDMTDSPQYVLHIENTSLVYLDYSTSQSVNVYDTTVGSWSSTSARYMTFTYTHDMDTISNLWWVIENTTPIKGDSIYRYWDLNTISSSSMSDLLGLYSRHYNSNEDVADGYQSIEFSIRGHADGVQEEFTSIEINLDTQNITIQPSGDTIVESGVAKVGYVEFNPETIESEYIADISILNAALDIMSPVHTVKGSWIWNESVADNLSDLRTHSYNTNGDHAIRVNFSASDTSGDEQSCTHINWLNDGYLEYNSDSDSNVAIQVVDFTDTISQLNPQHAAMHFGDEPQSVLKYFYDFLVANAEYMSGGFGYED